jgi:hypothetical protein
MQVAPLNRKLVGVRPDTHSRINNYGTITDTFDDAINNIIDWAEASGLTREVLLAFVRERRG